MFFSNDGTGSASSLFWGVAPAEGLSSMFLPCLSGQASIAASVARCGDLCRCELGGAHGGSPLPCCCLGEANGQLSCDALPDVRKMTLLGVFVIFLFVKGVVVSSSVLPCTIVVLI